MDMQGNSVPLRLHPGHHPERQSSGILRNQSVQDVLLTFNTSPFTFQLQSKQIDISSTKDLLLQ